VKCTAKREASVTWGARGAKRGLSIKKKERNWGGQNIEKRQ